MVVDEQRRRDGEGKGGASGLANVVVDELNVLTTRTQRMVFKKWRNSGCDCDGGTAKRWRTVLAKAGYDHGEGGTTTAKRGGTRRRREAGHDGEGGTTTAEAGHDCEERGTAKRWRTVSAKAGHDAEERQDSDEERRDDVEKRRDSDEKRRDQRGRRRRRQRTWDAEMVVVSGREQKLCS